MHEFERLIGQWRVEGEIPTEPPTRMSGKATLERLGPFVVFRSASGADVPDSISMIGGAPEGQPQPMEYFDGRGVRRRYLTTIEGLTWRIWRDPAEGWSGPEGPGFNQRFVGEISADGRTIKARWERGLGPAGDRWEVDFPLTYTKD